ncbi:AMP-binding protein [Xanthomarina sp. GH4-25]|uniref:AMP-binding protein n=1 Tax=Xanthomarina sp. GH4-25 TaxID=3349335 RepID=UPI003877DD66
MSNFQSPLEAFLHWEANSPNQVFLKQPIKGKLRTYTFAEAGNEARRIAAALQDYNLPDESHVALLSKNCAHWMMADLAIMMAGYVSIPIYPTLNDISIQQILEHSNSKVIIIGKLDNYSAQKSGIKNIPKICVDLYDENDGESWEEIVNKTQPLEDVTLPSLDKLHTIIYTSGTTGTPKGVMHTVGNFIKSANIMKNVMNLPQGSRFFSYLPLAHVAERMGIATHGFVIGAEFSFPESLDSFASDLEQCQPHIFFAVPRIWAKFQEKILEKMPKKKLSILLTIPILNGIIKKKLKQKLGLKEAKFIISGAAPLSVNLMYWYKKIGVEILQGYGMTEDCIISHFNLPNENMIGTVGKRLSTVQTKLSVEGEVLIKNDCLMTGYYKAPELTASVFTEDGYLKTGDIGEYNHEGYLTITGRVKDQFKTDKGNYISPSLIELNFSKNNSIEQICIVGTGIPQPIALITLSELGKSKTKNLLIQSLKNSVKEINKDLSKHEKIEKIIIMKEDWSVDNGMTTPTLKVKRNSIEKVHQPLYKSWFDMEDKVIFE